MLIDKVYCPTDEQQCDYPNCLNSRSASFDSRCKVDWKPNTSADEALILQKALDEQRERIAAAIKRLGCSNTYGCGASVLGQPNDDHDVTLCPIAIAAAIRSGEIGGEQK